MPRSTDRRTGTRRARAAALLLGVGLAVPASAAAEDGTLRVYESALNDFAAALQPLTLTRSFVTVLWIPVPNPFLFGIPTPMPVPISCLATGSVTGLAFDVTPSAVAVRGNLSGSVCGVAYSSSLSSPVTIAVDSAASSLVVRPAGPLRISARVSFLGFNVQAPFGNLSLAPSLTVASIPLGGVAFELETPHGPRSLVLVTRNHQLSLQDGYLEIKADAHFR